MSVALFGQGRFRMLAADRFGNRKQLIRFNPISKQISSEKGHE